MGSPRTATKGLCPPPSVLQDRSQKRFILTALRALLKLDPDSHLLMVELMANYLQAPESTR